MAGISRYVNLPRSGSVQTVVEHEKEEMNGDLESGGISANSTSAPGRARIGLGATAAVVLPLLYLLYPQKNCTIDTFHLLRILNPI